MLSGELRLAGRLDARFFALLRAVQGSGSLQKAARAAGYSYKGAWLVLETAGNLARTPLVVSQTGGRRGGGSQLTPAAVELLHSWQQLQQRHHRFLAEQDAWLLSHPHLVNLLRSLSMKASARNQFSGTVTDVSQGPATTQVTLDIGHGHSVTASLTSAAATRLGVAVGQPALALVKSSEVVLVCDFAGYKLSARNQLAGSVSRVQKGAVSSLVGITLPGGAVITASVTNDAVDALAVAVGQPATASFKAYAVMLAVPA
ncbi:LysR family transcriptional regulator [Pelomonas saccharophila]|nr:LysR family transcriptional regulator [Roseateles saccharophilus]